jgi:glyoxylase-like metal-dependent hydrolase (beta-lactamase superfamily II)
MRILTGKAAVVAAALACATPAIHAHQGAAQGSPAAPARVDESKLEIGSREIAPGLHLLSGAGGNMLLLVGDDGPVLVDDSFGPTAPRLRAAIALITPHPVRFVIDTHWHWDHSGGNESLGRSGAVIVAHENTRRRLAAGSVVDFYKHETPPQPREALPVITFEDGVALHLDGEDIVAQHLPAAHTDTDIALHFSRAHVVHMGDVFTNLGYPFIDESSGGTIDGMIAGAARVLARIDDTTIVVPGHGPLASKADLQAYHDMLATVRGRIADLIRKGRSLEQVVAARPTQDFDARYGRGATRADVWVGRVYVDLRKALAPGKPAAPRR